jgi:hypothetical protein
MQVNGSEGTLELLLRAFAARDLAEPLPSFDETTAHKVILAAMDSRRMEVVGVRRSGRIAAWLSRDELTERSQKPLGRPFDQTSLIDATAPLNDVVTALGQSVHLFVRTFGEVGGIITRNDLQKPAMRMWLFGLITITETRVTRLIDERFPNGSWQQHLSTGRIEKASEFQRERLRRGEDRSVLECLQFADKGRIVARDEGLRQLTRFSSKRAVEDFVSELQTLRNNLAHSQDLAGDWKVILELATNLHRIVLGKDSEQTARTQ